MSFFSSISEYTGGQIKLKCHVCGDYFLPHQPAVTHDGHAYFHDSELAIRRDAYGTIHLHPECATILVLRLSADIMKQQHQVQFSRRVVESLAKVRKSATAEMR